MTRRALLASTSLLAAEDALTQLLRRAISHDEANLDRMRSYVFELTDKMTPVQGESVSQSFEVNLVGGSMYWRKLTQDGQPLTADLADLEQKRLRIHLASASRQAPTLWREERDVLANWFAAHRFKQRGQTVIDGRKAMLIDSAPYHFIGDLGYLTAARGKLTIDRETGHWLDAEFEMLDRSQYEMSQLMLGRLSLPYSVGLINRAFLPVRSKLHFGVQLNPDGLWVPRFHRIETKAYRSELSFGEFRRFTSESQLLVG